MVSSTTPRFGPRWPPFLDSLVISSWRTSSASCVICSTVNFLRCEGSPTRSKYRLVGLFINVRSFEGFERRLTGGVLFKFLDFEFGFFQFFLANLYQASALLEAREQRF